MIPNSLFTSSFRWLGKCLRFLKRAGMILAVLALLFFSCRLLDYMYVHEDQWFRILWHHYYEEERNIDNLFLGSSHVYADLNPMLLDALNGQNNFNLSSPVQRLNASYYLLKEADDGHNLSHVYLELYYDVSTGAVGEFDTPEELHWNWGNTDYMKPSLNKVQFMLTMGRPENYADIFLPFVRYREHMLDSEWIHIATAAKQEEGYRSYACTLYDLKGIVQYLDKGYQYSTLVLQEGELLCPQNKLADAPLTADAEKYLRMIIGFCRENDIALTLFINPIHGLQMASVENYEAYTNQIRSIAGKYGLDFYDFNLCREEWLDMQKPEYFADTGHLNSNGAGVFTPFFWQVVSGSSEENKKYFYDSYAEKLAALPPQTYGLLYTDDEGQGIRLLQVASNREEGLEYRIAVTPEGGEERIVQDFSENREFAVPLEEHGICTVSVRAKEAPEDVRTLQIGRAHV